jgi:hypothetical protein
LKYRGSSDTSVPCPGREDHLRLRGGKFHLRDHQALVLAVEDIDLPGQMAVVLDVAMLVDQRTFAELIQDECRILERNPVLELRAGDPRVTPLMVSLATGPSMRTRTTRSFCVLR